MYQWVTVLQRFWQHLPAALALYGAAFSAIGLEVNDER